MNDLFGIPMNSIMVVLLVGLGLSLSVIGYVVLRNRIMFKMGVRNIPRRVAQSVLIVIGLMLSTLIISAALTTGDTVDHSVTKLAYDWLGHMDEAVVFNAEDSVVAADKAVVPQSAVAELKSAFANDPNVDGIAPAIFEPVPVIDNRTKLSSPTATMLGADPASMNGFPDIVTRDGKKVDLTGLADDQVYLNAKGAKELDARAGDTVTIFVENSPYTFTVVDIVKDTAFTGAINLQGQGESLTTEGMVTRLEVAQKLFGREGELDAIAISNRGGVRDSMGLTEVVTAKAEAALTDPNLKVEKMKQDFVDQAEIIGNVMTTMFVVMGLFSIAAGILLIFMIFVMLAAERKPEMGMTRALGAKRGQLVQSFLSEGMAYNLGSALVGAALGVLVAIVMTRVMASLFSQFGVSIEPYVTPRSLIVAYSLGVVVTFVTVVFSSFRASRLNIVRAIRDIPEPTYRRATRRTLIFGIIGILLGLLLAWSGLASNQFFPHSLGVSLVLLCLAPVLRYLALPERPVFTIVGLLLLGFWAMPPAIYERIYPDMDFGDIEMFFLSGIMMVAAATFVIVYNADLILVGVQRLGGRLGRILPAVRMAVAYPLASRFRTGMTMAMIALVVFAVTMMSIMNTNFNALFLRDDSRGGWDVVVTENPNNPMGDLRTALEANPTAGVDTTRFASVGAILFPNQFTGSEVRQVQDGGIVDDWVDYPIQGLDEGFLAAARIPLQTRARGYENDAAVWQALATTPNLAVVDAFMVQQGGGFGPPPELSLKGVKQSDKVMDPPTLEIRDPASKQTASVTVIGITNFGASSNFYGIYLSGETFKGVFGPPDFSRFYVQLKSGTNSGKMAKAIEAALVTKGAQADSLKEQIKEQQATSNAFFYLIQGFMGMGLLVGTAAVGVIAFRSVVERRQEIGMLRAIGFQRGAVALSLLLETSFIAILGVASGLGLAVLLAFNVLSSNEFGGVDMGFIIPWWELILVSAFAYGASFLMTVIPSRQASGVAIADALRYE